MMKSSKGKASRKATMRVMPANGTSRVAMHSAEEAVSTVAPTYPTLEQIRMRAYELYLERGTAPGGELHDWITAERELIEVRARP